MKKLIVTLVAVASLLACNAQTSNMDVDRINVRIAFGPPVQDTIASPYKIGELRTRPQDNLWYRYNGNIPGLRRWDYVYFGPSNSIIPTLDQVLSRGNVSTLPLTAGVGTFTGIKIPNLGQVGQILMATIGPDGTLAAQTIPGGGTLINSINGLTASAQFLTVTFNVATSPKITSVTATHTLNLPIVNSLDTGIVTPVQKAGWDAKATYPAGGTTAKYLRGDTTWQTFPTIPAQLNPSVAGGGITITGTYPNLLFTVSSTGTLTGLSGDVTTSGSGAAVATIQPNVVSYAKMQQVTANRLLGNPTGSTANIAEIALNTGTGIGFASSLLRIDTGTIATLYRVGFKLNISDTTAMLANYYHKADTVTLSNRINAKPNGSGTSNALAYWSASTTLASAPINYTTGSGGLLTHTVASVFNSSNSGAVAPITINASSNDLIGINSSSGSTQSYYSFINAISSNDQSLSIKLINQSTNFTTGNQASSGLELITNQAGSDAYVAFNDQSTTSHFITGITRRYNNSNTYFIGFGPNQSFLSASLLYGIGMTGDAVYAGNGALKIHVGTTLQRPSVVTSGMLRFNIDSNAFEFSNQALVWRVIGTGGSGGGSSSGALLIANNLNDLNNATIARNNLGLGTLSTLSSINNVNWSGTVLSAANGGTGLSGAGAANGRILIGNGTGYTLASLTNTTPDVFLVTNGSGSIGLGIDTNKLVTRAFLLSNPSTIALTQVGVGFTTIYAAGGGTQIRVKGLAGDGTTIGITRQPDSSMVWSSLLLYPTSVTRIGSNVAFVNDVATPGNWFFYGTNGSGVKGYQSFTSAPVATNTTNGLFPFGYKKRIDSGVVIMNAPSLIAALGYDSIVTASNSLDTLYHKVFNVQGTTNRVAISKVGSSVFINAYTIDIDAAYAGQSSITTLGTIASGLWHGTPIQTTYGGAPTGGTTGQVLTKNSGADYDYAWAASAGGGGAAGLVTNVGAGYRWVKTGISSNIKSIVAGSAITIDSTTNTDALTISVSSIVSSLTGTGNQIAVSSATGGVTLSIPTQLTITNLTTSGTNIFTGTTYQAPNGKLDMIVMDTTTGRYYKQAYYWVDTAGYAAGSTYLTFNGTKVIMSTTSSSAVTANTIYGNATGSTASPTFFNPSLTSSLFANEGTTATVLHGNAAGNPTWAAIALASEVSGTLPQANGGTGFSTYTLGDILYASAANTLSKLTGNITSAKQVLTQTGTGSVSAAPVWGAPSASDLNTWFGTTIESTSNKSTTTSLGTSNTLYPTQNAVKTYVDALSTVYFPIAGGSLTGTAGAGFVGLITQSSAPSTPASGVRLYSGAGNALAFRGITGAVTTIQAGGSGTYILPDLSGSSDNIVLLAAAQTMTNKTLTSPQFNFGTNGVGDIYYRNSGGTTSRLPIGTADGQVLTTVSGLPVWQTPSASISGTYIGTCSILTNATSPSWGGATYSRTGNVVTVAGYVNLTNSATGDVTFTISLPIAQTVSNSNCYGTVTADISPTIRAAGYLTSYTTTTAFVRVYFANFPYTTPIYFHFSYSTQ